MNSFISKSLNHFHLHHLILCLAACLCSPLSGWAAQATFVNFEGHQTRPACLSPDGKKLFVVNTPAASLSVFDVSGTKNPVLIAEIPVGIEPVSVNAFSNDVVWVVNEVSDSVSVVSVSRGEVTDTLPCKDEPSDVVFSGAQAFVSCSRSNSVRVFDVESHAQITEIPLDGLNPRSLTVSADGTKIYAAFAMAGNQTTILPSTVAPPPPSPTNPDLPPPPQVALIVSASDVRLPVKSVIPSYGVAEIDAATSTPLRYFPKVGTVNFFVAARPGTSELWVANTEARNLIRFEPNLKGHAVDNRLTRINTLPAGKVIPIDLNPGVDYTVFPNPAAQATALAQPTGIAFEADGAFLWVTSFGTDRVARINAGTGLVVTRVETGPVSKRYANPAEKRGPRGLVLQAASGRLFVVNRISNTLSVVSTSTAKVVTELPIGSHDPTPAVIRKGRGFLYDARLSGNGTQSCASCHIDGDRDDLAWDLGDQGGSMTTISQKNPLNGTVETLSLHPMKGPMTTQTLRGLNGLDPLHWRGDKASFLDFNGAFESLMGGSRLSDADMRAFRDYVNTIVFQPNPNLKLDGSFPATVPEDDPDAGDPTAGQEAFTKTPFNGRFTCNNCHRLPTGSNLLVIPAQLRQEEQPIKVPHLRNVYQRLNFSPKEISLSGFGLSHTGKEPTVYSLISNVFFGAIANDDRAKRNLAAFVKCIDTGTAPAVGYTRTAHPDTIDSLDADWDILEQQAAAGRIDLILQSSANGKTVGFLYVPQLEAYGTSESTTDTFTRQQITAGAVEQKSRFSIMGVPPGSGYRFAIDRNENRLPDGTEK